LRIAN